MEFVNEDDRATGFEFVNHALEAFLKLPAIHRASNKGAHIQLKHAFFEQKRRDIAFNDALGETFHDGGLAHARFTDQGRIILGAARQNLDDAFNLFLTPNDWIELASFSQRSQVCSQLVHQG